MGGSALGCQQQGWFLGYTGHLLQEGSLGDGPVADCGYKAQQYSQQGVWNRWLNGRRHHDTGMLHTSKGTVDVCAQETAHKTEAWTSEEL